MAPSKSPSFSTLASLGPVRRGLELDVPQLEAYIRKQLPGLLVGPGSGLSVSQFSHGQSNPTYLVTLQPSGRRLVLRKKPPGKLLASAHAVDREYAVLAALSAPAARGFPVPRPLLLCTEDQPIGTPFYLMDCAEGRIFLDPNLPELLPQQRSSIYQQMAQVLAALHRLPPGELPLPPSFGNPRAYCARQLHRWSAQYRASVPQFDPQVLRLMTWLGEHIPAEDANPPRPAICHGDYRLDNIVFSSSSNNSQHDNASLQQQSFTPLAVLDWELCTLGNPWADVAYNCLPYHLPDLAVLQRLRPDPRTGRLPDGVPSEAEYLASYCTAAGVAVPSPQDWAFYLALSLFRLLAILAGVQARAKQGNASSANAAAVAADDVLAALAAAALGIIDRAEGQQQQQKGQQQAGGSGRCGSRVAACSCGSATATAAAASAGKGADGGGAGGGPGTGAVPGGLLGMSELALELRRRLVAFMEQHVYPAEEVLEAHAMGPQESRWTIHPLMEELKSKAKQAGLWNLWLPASLAASLTWLQQEAAAQGSSTSCSSPASDAGMLLGAGLSNLEYAHLCEVMGRSAWAPEVFNCSAPDTGNMEVLAKYGNRDQQRAWLLPLLRGCIRSCFAMTEKAVASSDATNITASIVRSPCGGIYTVDGVKWWTSGAMDPRCKIAVFMGKTDPSAPPHKQQSMILVPMDTPGVKVVRPMLVFGFDDAPHGHAEVHFTRVTVPASNLILGEGRGFEIAQGRLGPGRLHHCMRLVGAGERAVELMARRALQRKVFGGPLAAQGAFRAELAKCRIEVDGARLLVLAAADSLDRHGFKGAAGAIAAAKVAAPNAVLRVLDAAMQAHGGAGVSQDFVLARLWAAARTLRIADGPDEVHLGTIAKMELGKHSRL